MRIAILDSYFNWPPSGGGIRDVKEVASGLAKKGYEPILIILEYGYRGVVTGNFNFEIQKIKFNKFDFTGFNLYRRIKSVLSRLQPDVVLVGNGNLLKPYMILASRKYPVVVRLYAYGFLCSLYYGLLFKNSHVCDSNYISSPHKCIPCMLNKKYVSKLNFETLRSFSFILPLYHHLVKESLKIPKKFILTSDYMKRRFSEVIPLEKLEIIPSGVATDKFKPYEIEKSNREIKHIFFPSRPDDPLKGVNTLINAANILWKQRRDFRILVTGNTNINIEKYPFLIQKSWKSENEICSTYASSDLAVVPSLWAEPFGLAALEAMSCGIAVIASQKGGLTDFIEDGKTGILVPPGDYKTLASKMDELLDNDEYRLKLGAEARKHAFQYSWSNIINKYVSVIDDACVKE